LKAYIATLQPILEKLGSQHISVPPSSSQKEGEKATIVNPAIIHHPKSTFQPPPQKGVKISKGGSQTQAKKQSESSHTSKGKEPEVDPTIKVKQAASEFRQTRFMKTSETFSRVFNEATIRSVGFCDTRDIIIVPKESFSTKIHSRFCSRPPHYL